MAASQTTTIETVNVIRPLKVVSAICLVCGIFCAAVALGTPNWLRSGSFRTGLFQECTDADDPRQAPPLAGAPPPGKCHPPARDSGFIKASAGLVIAGLIATVLSFLLNVCGLVRSDARKKYLLYRVAIWLAIIAVLVELAALIAFPFCFYGKMKEYGSRREWEVDWSYGFGWGAALFVFGASLLLICDKEHEEVYYKEKTVYNCPPELS